MVYVAQMVALYVTAGVVVDPINFLLLLIMVLTLLIHNERVSIPNLSWIKDSVDQR
jgi:hypothetical protein